MTDDELYGLPSAPEFTDEFVEQCRQQGDMRPILFEWYKFVGLLANYASRCRMDSPGFRNIPAVHYAVMMGLLNRCSRLMCANLRLSSEGLYGETTRLLDRSIAESAIKVQWLCHKDDSACFDRFLADGLKKDMQLKVYIEENISNRGGSELEIEARMLRSIDRCVTLSGMTATQIDDAKRLQNFKEMCKDLNLGDFFYTAIQQMGSHAVHGTWSELAINFLCHDDVDGFFPSDHEIETQDIQFVIVARLVLAAAAAYVRYVILDESGARFVELCEAVEEHLNALCNMDRKTVSEA